MSIYRYLMVFGIVLLISACTSTAPIQTILPATTQIFQINPTAAPVTLQAQPEASAQSLQPYPYPGPAILSTTTPSPNPYPGIYPPYPAFTPSPTKSPTPTSLPERIEIHFNELGLLWRECELPRPVNESQEECLGVTMSDWAENDRSIFADTFTPPGGLMRGFRLTIGDDVFEALHQPSPDGGFSDANGIHTYNLFRNGQLLLSMITTFSAYDPNAGLLNINGKYAWEFADPRQPTIIYDGVDLRQEFDLEGAYRPYVIGETMIFVAKNNEKMFVMANGEQIGPTFDEIYNGYCCETTSIVRLPGQYWFWATSEGRRFVVVITSEP